MTRPGQPAGGFQGYGGSPPTVLGSLLVEYWDSTLGIALTSGNVDTWTGQKLGTVVSAPGAGARPLYGVDGGYFRGDSLVQCIGETRTLTSLDVGELLAASSRPYVFALFVRKSGGPGGRAWQLNKNATFDSQVMFSLPSDPTHRVVAGGSHDLTTAVSVDTAHFAEYWLNGGTGFHVGVDGSETAAADATATSGLDFSVRQVSFATLGTGLTAAGDTVSFRYFGLCSSEPSAAQRGALLAWARSKGTS
jgi:hypothetical protein